MTAKINPGCIGCGLCVQTCPYEAITLDDGIAHVDPEKCTNCGACVDSCPVNVIILDKPATQEQPKAAQVQEVKSDIDAIKREVEGFQGVWVFIEQVDSEAAPVSWELLGEGRKLADSLQTSLAGVLLGSEVGKIIPQIFQAGADKIYLIDDPVLKDYRTMPYAEGIVNLTHKYKPEIILMGATTLGRDLSGTVATKLHTGLTADCTMLAISDGGLLEQTRPAFGGNIMATILCRHKRPQMATVRPRVFATPEFNRKTEGEIIKENLGVSEDEVGVKILERIIEKGNATYLDKAEIIVAGGKGIGGRENFAILKDLADVLGGTLGASRAAVEAGWIGVEHQVGQTGVTVRPKIYFAIGISGAIQHIVGMQTSDIIVAINIDPEAQIFKVADYGLAGDWTKIVPALTEKFRQGLT